MYRASWNGTVLTSPDPEVDLPDSSYDPIGGFTTFVDYMGLSFDWNTLAFPDPMVDLHEHVHPDSTDNQQHDSRRRTRSYTAFHADSTEAPSKQNDTVARHD